MQSILTMLHAIVQAFPYDVELAVLGILALGWLAGNIRIEYNQLLHRSSALPLRVVGLCGVVTLLVALGLLADIFWSQTYARLPRFGGLVLLMLIIGGVGQSLSHRAALGRLVAEGYERPALHILPKQRR